MKPLQQSHVAKSAEMFIGLFLALAVALIIAKTLHGYHTTQTIPEDWPPELIEPSKVCNSYCQSAISNGCQRQDLATLCLAYGYDGLGKQYLDLDGSDSVTEVSIGRYSTCEDKIPCNVLVGSCCSLQITPESCAQILAAEWRVTEPNVCAYHEDVFSPGSCTFSDTHWYVQSEITICAE